ncbi:hypothetical protein [Alicyclobacillus fastidiosus]|uniref:HEAT repeat domain-containing protein n=1 Tax=Alicyclobacillus fastidiosus TaxID=392011 RepID=A0ABV5AL91_9BACL|nr:hypothetical protein [Alicyclobacillus fastidiosus]WEH08227.1 hypothetical protein PYS47_16170 [Alicyclobacillus fastidiosus]
MDLHDKCWVARTLAEKNLKEAVPFLLSIFYDWNGEPWDLWAVGNALYVIDDKASYSPILEICKNKKYGSGTQMLMGTLARMKTPEAFQVLVDCLGDEHLRGHAIEVWVGWGTSEQFQFWSRSMCGKDYMNSKQKHGFAAVTEEKGTTIE